MVRQDGGDAGAHVVALDEGHLSDPHAGDIGDGVQRPRREDAGLEPDVAGAGTLFGRESHRDQAAANSGSPRNCPEYR